MKNKSNKWKLEIFAVQPLPVLCGKMHHFLFFNIPDTLWLASCTPPYNYNLSVTQTSPIYGILRERCTFRTTVQQLHIPSHIHLRSGASVNHINHIRMVEKNQISVTKWCKIHLVSGSSAGRNINSTNRWGKYYCTHLNKMSNI